MPGQALVTIRDKQWQVSLATAPWELQRGLGGITGIPAGTGMLFDVGWQQIIQVSTVPMLFLLDIAFFSDSMVVTEVYQNVAPNHMVTSQLPARYFLEVNAGELAGIEAGDRASVELLAPAIAPLQAPNWVQAMFSFMAFAMMATFMFSIAKSFIKGILPSGKKKSLPSAHHPGIRTDLMRKWYDKGVEAGRTDGWMDVENTMRQTLEAHPKIKDADDLIWTDVEGWEQTDHFSILYGSKMMADAEGDYDLYSDLKSEFWEGYFKGRMDIGIDIHKRARELVGKGGSGSSKQEEPKRCIVCGREFPAAHMIYLHTEKAYICKECYWPEMRRRYPSRPIERVLTFREEEIRDRFKASQREAIKDELETADYFRRSAAKNRERAREFTDLKIKAAWENAAKVDEEAEQYFRQEAEKRQKAIEKAQRKEIWQYIPMDEQITYERWYELTGIEHHSSPGIIVLPKLPEEAKGDVLFYEYIRDLSKLRKEPISEEEARWLWEGWEGKKLGIAHHSPPFTLQDLETMERYLDLARKLTRSVREATE